LAALVGELLVLQAGTRGGAATLVDFAVRDVDELVALGLPTWARPRTPGPLTPDSAALFAL